MASERLTVDFVCRKCGMMTPGRVYIPDASVAGNRPVHLTNECRHCGAEMERRFVSLAALRVAASKSAGGPR